MLGMATLPGQRPARVERLVGPSTRKRTPGAAMEIGPRRAPTLPDLTIDPWQEVCQDEASRAGFSGVLTGVDRVRARSIVVGDPHGVGVRKMVGTGKPQQQRAERDLARSHLVDRVPPREQMKEHAPGRQRFRSVIAVVLQRVVVETSYSFQRPTMAELKAPNNINTTTPRSDDMIIAPKSISPFKRAVNSSKSTPRSGVPRWK